VKSHRRNDPTSQSKGRAAATGRLYDPEVNVIVTASPSFFEGMVA
jgi:hypothetical protein